MICSKCGSPIDENSAFCEKCGTPIEESAQSTSQSPIPTDNPKEETSMFCAKCGAPIDEASRFCEKCGTPIEEANPQSIPQPSTPIENPTERPSMFCTKCGSPVDANNSFCAKCGTPIGKESLQSAASANYSPVAMNLTDHTMEFSAKDISDNKVMAELPYLLGIFGVIISLLAAHESAYTYFHVRQALKITIVNVLVTVVMLLFCWTITWTNAILFVAGICSITLLVIRIICFFQVCYGQAKEPVIISRLGFLK